MPKKKKSPIITKNKVSPKALEHLFSINKQAELILDSAPIGMALISLEGKYLHVNQALCEIVGYSEKELLQLNWKILTYPDDLEANLLYMKKLMRGEMKTFQMEKRYIHKYGHAIWVQLNVTLIRDVKKVPRYTIVQVQDISQRKKIEEQLHESEQRYRLVQKATENVIWDWDLVHDRMYVSDNFLTTFKYDPKYIKEQKFKQWWLERIHPDDKKRIENAWEQIIEKNKDDHFVVEYRLLKGDGEYAHLLSQGYIFYKQGKAVRMLGAKIDITARKQAEFALKQSEQRYSMIFNNVSDLISIIDPEANYLFVSPSHKEILGYSADELMGVNALSLIHPDDLPKVLNGYHEVLSGSEALAQFRVRHKNGTFVTLVGSGRAIVDAYGKPFVLVITSHDISERIELEKRKDRFLSMTSHELRTPLTVLKAYVQILQQQKANDTMQSTYLKKMDTEIERLISLFSKLWDLSLIDGGGIELHPQNFRLDRMIKEIVHDLQPISSQQEFVVRIKTPVQIFADKFRLTQVLVNLLINAINFSPQKGNIVISAVIEANMVKIAIQDTGIGISKEDCHKIFDPFYQANTVMYQSRMGLGLGLYIVSEIVKKHNGTIEVISEVGKGSTFHVYLPVVKTIIKREPVSMSSTYLS